MPNSGQDVQFTELEHAILRMTADGECHEKDELLTCFDDPAADYQNLYQLLFRLRPKLEQFGQEIVAQSFGRGSKYRRMRHLRALPLMATGS